MKKLKPKKCKFSQCGKTFTPFNSLQRVCPGSVECARGFVEEKWAAKRSKEARKAQRDLKSNDRRHQIKLTQAVFNQFIRTRDHDQPCISCGRSNAEVDQTDTWKYGGAWDCGHYLTIGSHPELRFEKLNAHKQCKNCNGGAGNYTRKNHTVRQDYRDQLIERIGLESVEWLEGPHESKHYTAADLIELRKELRAETRQLEKARAA